VDTAAGATTADTTASLEDLDWCQDQVMPANPVYLITLPTKNDPMLGYLSTSFQDHVRLRDKFGFKVNDAMWDFYKRIGIVDANDKYTKNYGAPSGCITSTAWPRGTHAPRTPSTRKAGRR
jgi:ethanolamine ammonia-lyase large subunit